MKSHTNDPAFRQFEEQLTPYVQGILDSASMHEVEQFAEESPEFREMLQFEKQIACSVRTEGAAASAPSFNALRERLNNEQGNVLQRFLQPVIDGLRGFSMQAVLASILAVSVGTYSVMHMMTAPFETLTADEVAVVPSADRAYFQVAFVVVPGEEELHSISAAMNFRVESGPTSIGSYVISVDRPTALDSNELARLREDSRFLMVEPLASQTTEPSETTEY